MFHSGVSTDHRNCSNTCSGTGTTSSGFDGSSSCDCVCHCSTPDCASCDTSTRIGSSCTASMSSPSRQSLQVAIAVARSRPHNAHESCPSGLGMTVGSAFTVRELDLDMFALADDTAWCVATLMLRAQVVERTIALRSAKDIGADVEVEKLSQPRVPARRHAACIRNSSSSA